MSTQGTTVGVIGLGLLGFPIAVHLKRSGFDVVGFDTDPDRRSEAAEIGVRIMNGNRDVATEARTIVSVLPHADAFRAVCEELKAIRDGERRILADVSTLQIEEKSAAAKSLLPSNITLLDCPVLGTSAQAHAGELVMCASGPPDAYEEVQNIVRSFTRRCEYVGELGAGTKLKLVANLLVGIHNAAVAEALTFAKCMGLDAFTVLNVLTGSAAGSRQLELRGPMMASGKFQPATATATVFAKDVRLISEQARSVNCPVPMHSTAANLYTSALAQGYAELDLSCVALVLAAMAGNTKTE